MSDKRTDPRACVRTPKGHFSPDGLSQGKAKGPVRPTPDASQGKREEQREDRSRAR